MDGISTMSWDIEAEIQRELDALDDSDSYNDESGDTDIKYFKEEKERIATNSGQDNFDSFMERLSLHNEKLLNFEENLITRIDDFGNSNVKQPEDKKGQSIRNEIKIDFENLMGRLNMQSEKLLSFEENVLTHETSLINNLEHILESGEQSSRSFEEEKPFGQIFETESPIGVHQEKNKESPVDVQHEINNEVNQESNKATGSEDCFLPMQDLIRPPNFHDKEDPLNVNDEQLVDQQVSAYVDKVKARRLRMFSNLAQIEDGENSELLTNTENKKDIEILEKQDGSHVPSIDGSDLNKGMQDSPQALTSTPGKEPNVVSNREIEDGLSVSEKGKQSPISREIKENIDTKENKECLIEADWTEDNTEVFMNGEINENVHYETIKTLSHLKYSLNSLTKGPLPGNVISEIALSLGGIPRSQFCSRETVQYAFIQAMKSLKLDCVEPVFTGGTLLIIACFDLVNSKMIILSNDISKVRCSSFFRRLLDKASTLTSKKSDYMGEFMLQTSSKENEKFLIMLYSGAQIYQHIITFLDESQFPLQNLWISENIPYSCSSSVDLRPCSSSRDLRPQPKHEIPSQPPDYTHYIVKLQAHVRGFLARKKHQIKVKNDQKSNLKITTEAQWRGWRARRTLYMQNLNKHKNSKASLFMEDFNYQKSCNTIESEIHNEDRYNRLEIEKLKKQESSNMLEIENLKKQGCSNILDIENLNEQSSSNTIEKENLNKNISYKMDIEQENSSILKNENVNKNSNSDMLENETLNKQQCSNTIEIENQNKQKSSGIVEIESLSAQEMSTRMDSEHLNAEDSSNIFEVESLNKQEMSNRTDSEHLNEEDSSNIFEVESLNKQEMSNRMDSEHLNIILEVEKLNKLVLSGRNYVEYLNMQECLNINKHWMSNRVDIEDLKNKIENLRELGASNIEHLNKQDCTNILQIEYLNKQCLSNRMGIENLNIQESSNSLQFESLSEPAMSNRSYIEHLYELQAMSNRICNDHLHKHDCCNILQIDNLNKQWWSNRMDIENLNKQESSNTMQVESVIEQGMSNTMYFEHLAEQQGMSNKKNIEHLNNQDISSTLGLYKQWLSYRLDIENINKQEISSRSKIESPSEQGTSNRTSVEHLDEQQGMSNRTDVEQQGMSNRTDIEHLDDQQGMSNRTDIEHLDDQQGMSNRMDIEHLDEQQGMSANRTGIEHLDEQQWLSANRTGIENLDEHQGMSNRTGIEHLNNQDISSKVQAENLNVQETSEMLQIENHNQESSEYVRRVVILQAIVRGFLARKRYIEVIEKINQQKRSEFVRSKVVILQANVRGFLARKYYREVVLKENQDKVLSLISKIQACWKGRRVRRSGVLENLRVEKNCRNIAITKIQALWRGFRIRKRFQSVFQQIAYDDDDDFEYAPIVEDDFFPVTIPDLLLNEEQDSSQADSPETRKLVESILSLDINKPHGSVYKSDLVEKKQKQVSNVNTDLGEKRSISSLTRKSDVDSEANIIKLKLSHHDSPPTQLNPRESLSRLDLKHIKPELDHGFFPISVRSIKSCQKTTAAEHNVRKSIDRSAHSTLEQNAPRAQLKNTPDSSQLTRRSNQESETESITSKPSPKGLRSLQENGEINLRKSMDSVDFKTGPESVLSNYDMERTVHSSLSRKSNGTSIFTDMGSSLPDSSIFGGSPELCEILNKHTNAGGKKNAQLVEDEKKSAADEIAKEWGFKEEKTALQFLRALTNTRRKVQPRQAPLPDSQARLKTFMAKAERHKELSLKTAMPSIFNPFNKQ